MSHLLSRTAVSAVLDLLKESLNLGEKNIMNTKDDNYFMRLALEEAGIAFSEGEIPVGAVLVSEGTILAKAHNIRERSKNPTDHAETIVIREGAKKLERWRLNETTLYVTKEPCIMCAGAIINSRIGRLVYGCNDEKGGAVSLYQLFSDRRLNHYIEVVSGVLEDECVSILKRFFQERRQKGIDIGSESGIIILRNQHANHGKT
jgi:tRNA(adenine34) deaminase